MAEQQQQNEAAPRRARQSHKKSRGGCVECKRRRIKCDEQRPSCFNCARYEAQCAYIANPSRRMPHRAKRDDNDKKTGLESTQPNTESSGTSSPEISHTTPSSDGADSQASERPPCLDPSQWAMDMSLMHHYCTNTAETMATRMDMQNIWRIVIPQQAREHPFVMHGILGLAAIHKAYLFPDQRSIYLDASAHHQSLGLGLFNALLSSLSGDLQGPNREEATIPWRPVLCFSMLVVAYVSTSRIRQTQSPINDILELFGAIRGIESIFGPAMSKVRTSDFLPMVMGVWVDHSPDNSTDFLDREEVIENSCLPPGTPAALERLRNWLALSPPPTAELILDYEKAVEFLLRCIKQLVASGEQPEIGIMLMWPHLLPRPILMEIRARSPFALVFLAHWAVFFPIMESRYWFIQGWGKALLTEIDKKLEGVYSDWLAWPRMCIEGSG
ncbi:hypothetical protein NM208_g9648 [Fusarium decemcellulare]|uniref:Uncharacterized protein n=1 Tax=Fusarium decemcellulare TaxID=57161 RepID=A0ACC1S113_9HYPO|nr:hypothetical protein NM208_g9648 [Fusarium decemcellulare]